MKNMRPTWRSWLRVQERENKHREKARELGRPLEPLREDSGPGDVPPGSLAMLTGQDARALSAIAACWQLYACADEDGCNAALAAVRVLLAGMQPKCRFLARELIPWAMDWKDRERVWWLLLREERIANTLRVFAGSIREDDN